MRIALRTSGGRGEYELAGRQDRVRNSDLFGDRIFFEVSPEIEVDSRSSAKNVDGKPRIRLEPGARHAYGYLSGVLLLPRPIREVRRTAAGPDFLREGKFAVQDIDVDVAEHSAGRVTLRPTRLLLRNRSGDLKSIDFAGRMASVQGLWVAATGKPDRLSVTLQAHQAAVGAGDFDRIERAAAEVRAALGVLDDPLAQALSRLGIDAEPPSTVTFTSADPAAAEGLDDPTPLTVAAKKDLQRWRLQAARGAAARRFAEAVKEAYRFRCAFSGEALPRMEDVTTTTAVDAAHILPWKTYDLNVVPNGLCLCKLCHWAFDNGVLRLDPTGAPAYELSIPPAVAASARASGFDIGWATRLTGPLSSANLPTDPAKLPSPAYLRKLNQVLFP